MTTALDDIYHNAKKNPAQFISEIEKSKTLASKVINDRRILSIGIQKYQGETDNVAHAIARKYPELIIKSQIDKTNILKIVRKTNLIENWSVAHEIAQTHPRLLKKFIDSKKVLGITNSTGRTVAHYLANTMPELLMNHPEVLKINSGGWSVAHEIAQNNPELLTDKKYSHLSKGGREAVLNLEDNNGVKVYDVVINTLKNRIRSIKPQKTIEIETSVPSMVEDIYNLTEKSKRLKDQLDKQLREYKDINDALENLKESAKRANL